MKTSSTQGSIVLASHGQYEMPFIDKSEATKRSKDRQIYGKCTNGTNRRNRVWPVCFIYIKLLVLIFLKRFQKLILISLHVIYIILSSWTEIRPLSLTSNPPYKCLKNYILPPPPPTLRSGLSSGSPLQIIIARSLKG